MGGLSVSMQVIGSQNNHQPWLPQDSILTRTMHGVHSFLSQLSDRRQEFLVSQFAPLVHLVKRAFIPGCGASTHLAVNLCAGTQHLHDAGGCEPGVMMNGETESSPRCTPKNHLNSLLTL